MKNPLLVAPIMIPMLTAIVALLAYRSRTTQRVISMTGAAALLAADLVVLWSVLRHGVLATQIGRWPAPFGITMAADEFSALMLVLSGLTGFAVAFYSLASIDHQSEIFGYHPVYHLLLMGVSGAFLTGDLFNLYVWFEVMLVASFVLMALGGDRNQMEGALKYVTLNLIASTLFLAGLGILYGLSGGLNMADLGNRFDQIAAEYPIGATRAVAMLFLVAFGIKAAAFPLFFWLPASYHLPSPAISALFAGLLTKVGVYAMIRVFTLVFVHDAAYTHRLILVVAGLTMTVGVLGAVAQNEFRRILSFHIVSQIGYMLMGLGLFTPLGLAASVFYIAHHIVVKTNLFLVSGVVERITRSADLASMGGLYRTRPQLAMLFLVPALSLAGIPPLSGFFAKLGLVEAGLIRGERLIVGVALGVSLLTLYSMMKIWNGAFWKPAPDEAPAPQAAVGLTSQLLPIGLLAAITVLIGFAAGPVFTLAQRAGERLINPAAYIRAVLEGGL